MSITIYHYSVSAIHGEWAVRLLPVSLFFFFYRRLFCGGTVGVNYNIENNKQDTAAGLLRVVAVC